MSVLISQVHVVPTLAFVLVSMPSTYKLTAGLLGSWVASSDGLPKMGGLLLHAVVFALLVYFLLQLTGGRSFADQKPPKGARGDSCTNTASCDTGLHCKDLKCQ